MAGILIEPRFFAWQIKCLITLSIRSGNKCFSIKTFPQKQQQKILVFSICIQTLHIMLFLTNRDFNRKLIRLSVLLLSIFDSACSGDPFPFDWETNLFVSSDGNAFVFAKVPLCNCVTKFVFLYFDYDLYWHCPLEVSLIIKNDFILPEKKLDIK